jgi:hypothetical protein
VIIAIADRIGEEFERVASPASTQASRCCEGARESSFHVVDFHFVFLVDVLVLFKLTECRSTSKGGQVLGDLDSLVRDPDRRAWAR